MSHTTQTTEPTTTPSRGISLWVNILILCVVLGAGGWFLWDQWIGGSPSADKPVDIGAVNYGRTMRRPMMVQPDPNPEGIYPFGPNIFRIHRGDYFMTLTPTESALLPLRLYYAPPDLIPTDVRGVLIQARNITQNPLVAKSKSLTPDQMNQLTQIMQLAGTGLILSDADRQTLRNDWKAYNDAKDGADKTAAGNTLLAAVKEIGARSLQPTRNAWISKAAEVRKILGTK